MKSILRTVLVSATIALTGFTAVTYTSCTEDKCKAIVCAYGGTCNDGVCTCPSGYEGPQCETINRERFRGIWQVNEDGTLSNAAQYAVSVDPGADITHVQITNFRNYLTANVVAHVKGDTLTIDAQAVNGNTVEGYAVLSDDVYYGDHGRLTVYYYIQDANGTIDRFGFGGGAPSKWNK